MIHAIVFRLVIPSEIESEEIKDASGVTGSPRADEKAAEEEEERRKKERLEDQKNISRIRTEQRERVGSVE